MSDSTRLGRARKKMLPVAILAAALVAMLAIAPLASAASDPIKSGTTTLTVNNGFKKKAKKAGIKITAVKPGKLKGAKATLTVTGGEIEPTTGVGTVTHSGGLKIAWGKKSVALKSLTISTKEKSVSAKIGGKTVKVASLAGTATARLGFGASVSAKKVKLTSAGAKALNSKLTPAPTKTKVKKKGKTIVKTVKVKPFFKANMVLGGSVTEVEPETVAVAPSGTMTFAGAVGLLGKLAAAEVKLEVIPPTTATGPTTFVSPISGGTISPLGTSGQVNSSGGLKLAQSLNLEALKQQADTTITLGSIGVDLAAKTGGVEVIGASTFVEPGSNPPKQPLNLGNLGRSSIADLAITATPSPATRTVTVSASGTIQAVASEVLNGFIKVHQVKATEDKTKKAFEKLVGEGKSPEEAKGPAEKQGAEEAAAEAKALEIKAGEPLGTFSFTATGE
ncbi:MAG TPA: hypothetical protein VMF55_03330 [Solirubrobacterales bacterium]|nr:hypothetical protein [Solirubrobacterales bacterium]